MSQKTQVEIIEGYNKNGVKGFSWVVWIDHQRTAIFLYRDMAELFVEAFLASRESYS